jgi:hypothetical protein
MCGKDLFVLRLFSEDGYRSIEMIKKEKMKEAQRFVLWCS